MALIKNNIFMRNLFFNRNVDVKRKTRFLNRGCIKNSECWLERRRFSNSLTK